MNISLKNFFRWLLFLPGAILGSWLMYILAILGQSHAWRYAGWDMNSTVPQIFMNFIPDAFMSAAFVYCGCFIAPMWKKKIAYFLAGLTLIPAFYGLFAGITHKDYWFVLNSIAVMCGSCGIAFSIYNQNSEHVDFEALLK